MVMRWMGVEIKGLRNGVWSWELFIHSVLLLKYTSKVAWCKPKIIIQHLAAHFGEALPMASFAWESSHHPEGFSSQISRKLGQEVDYLDMAGVWMDVDLDLI